MMVRLLAALLIGTAFLAAPARAEEHIPKSSPMPSAFTQAQRDEIVSILRTALRTDPSILRDAVAALQEDDGIRHEAAMRAAIGEIGPALNRSAANGDPVAGNPSGDVTIVEFYDLRCPYCRKMLPVMADLLRRDRGVRVIYKDIPILGPASVLGARAVLAAQRQDGYFKLHDAIMTGPSDITPDSLKAAALHVGLDWDRLQRDMDDPAIKARIDENLAIARKLEIQGTPAYLVGGQMMPGAMDIAELQGAVAEARKK